MQPSFLICEFAKATLSNLVKECFGSDFPDINQKKQVNYIYNYLSGLDAATVLLEPDYVDRDYLEDYARYYVKCFNRYGERCARIHFFKSEIDHSTISNIFTMEDPSSEIKDLQKNYLGFMVVKPLPKTFIGKTCLNLYPCFDDAHSRGVIAKTCHVNLFGIQLSVKSVPFQEQDKVISACATTSIWSALHALNKGSAGYVPSSSEITLSAINHITDSSNSFPNNGLTNKQILRALDTQRLRNHQVDLSEFDAGERDSTFRVIKAYIDSGIPVILGANVYEKEEVGSQDDVSCKLSFRGGHAVTILGYKELDRDRALYLHDDRLGPFVRANFDSVHKLFPDLDCEAKDGSRLGSCISLQEKSDDGSWLPVEQFLVPDSLIVPNYRKVRIPALSIDNTCLSIVNEFEQFLLEMDKDGGAQSSYKLTYSIVLEGLSDIRTRVLSDIRVKNKESILTKSSARFLWSAKFSLSGVEALEVLFDSTDIPQGNAISNIINYGESESDLILEPFKRLLEGDVMLPEATEYSFFTAFIRFLDKKETGLWDYLNASFGEPRAPKRLYDTEVDQNRLLMQKDVLTHYGRTDMELSDDFGELMGAGGHKIWAISLDGGLLIGDDIENKGHPTLTGFKFARIAGELLKDNEGWYINSKSSRYSSGYSNANDLLKNVRQKFLDVYSKQDPDTFRVEEYFPD